MENKEPLLRSDWTTYRGGAILFDGAEDCAIQDCTLDQVGGNGVFVNNYNRRIAVRGCHIVGSGRQRRRVRRRSERGPQSAVRVQPAAELQGHRQDARPQDRQLSRRLSRRGLPDPRDRPGREADRPRADLHVDGHHRPPLLDLRCAAGGDQHLRRHLRRPRDRVLRRLRHGPGDRRPRLVQLLGSRPLLGPGGHRPEHGDARRGQGPADPRHRQAEHPPQQPLAMRSRLGHRPGRRFEPTTRSTTTSA